MTKQIPLTKGKFAIVDDQDYEYLSQFKWHCLTVTHTCYAVRKTRGTSKFRGTILMHREILNAPAEMQVDHRDMNGLNNTRSNLRLATASDNRKNQPKRAFNTSGYKGVHKNKTTKFGETWCAYIKNHDQTIYIGSYVTAIEAAIAYDDNALKYHGEFAVLNFPIDQRPNVIPQRLTKGHRTKKGDQYESL